ncbi:hypothetical protein Tco_0866796 [Tanacetum coccineum]
MVNREVQLQALVDKKKVIITECTIRRDLQLEGANGVDSHEEMGEGSEIPTDPHHIPIIQPSTSQPQKKQSRRKHRKDTEIPQSSGPTKHIADEVTNEEHVPTQSNNPPLSRVNTLGSGEDRLSLKELMDLCIKLSDIVLDLETTKTAQAKEIASLKKRVKKLERKRKSKPPRMKILFKIGRSAQVVSSEDEEVTLIDETQMRNDDNLMFYIGVLDEQEVKVEKVVSTVEVTNESATTTTVNELNLAQSLIEIKAAKPKVKGYKVETDYELAQRLQAEEQEELTIEEKSKLFQQLLKKRRKNFAAKRAEERRSKPPTKAQQRSIMTTYLKNMAGWKPKDLKNKSFASVQELFENAMKRVNTLVDMDTELVEGSEIIEEEISSKRAGDELEQEPTKKQKVDDDKERDDLQQCFELVTEEDVAIKVIPLATKPAPIFDREDLENLWKLVKAKHGNTRQEEGYERVL